VRLANQMVGVDGAGEGIGGACRGTVAFFVQYRGDGSQALQFLAPASCSLHQ
jgi:hypothetical protein